MAAVSVVGLVLAWQNLAKSSELEVRLVRASELNARLKEMNLAAAGLAHETKNPLNVIRGLAQMLSKQADAPLKSDGTRMASSPKPTGSRPNSTSSSTIRAHAKCVAQPST